MTAVYAVKFTKSQTLNPFNQINQENGRSDQNSDQLFQKAHVILHKTLTLTFSTLSDNEQRNFGRFPLGQKWVMSKNKYEIKDVYEGYKFVWERQVEEIVCVRGDGWWGQRGASLPGYWWGGRYKEILTIHPLRFTTWRAWQYCARQLIALSVMWRQPVELNDFNLWHPLARASTPKTIFNFTKWYFLMIFKNQNLYFTFKIHDV